MKPSSAKAKGRLLQKWFANLLVEELDVDPEDLESRQEIALFCDWEVSRIMSFVIAKVTRFLRNK